MDQLSRNLDNIALDLFECGTVSGGMINLRDQGPPRVPSEQPHGGMNTPYWATSGAMRFGAGPWDSGYGSPTGPWPV